MPGIANCIYGYTKVKLLNIEYEKRIPSSNLIAIIEDSSLTYMFTLLDHKEDFYQPIKPI